MPLKRVVVTGMGILNSLGRGLEPVWKRLLAGENGIASITHFDASRYRCRVAAQIDALDGGKLSDPDSYDAPSPVDGVDASGIRRTAAVFVRCATDAFQDSGLSNVAPELVGLTVGTTVAYTDQDLTRAYFRSRRDDGKDVDLTRFARDGRQPTYSFHRRFGDMAAALGAKALKLRGPSMSMDTACAASGHAIGEAFRWIQSGKAVAMVSGGATAVVSPLGILYFGVLGALSPNPDPASASRPFDKDRDGFVMGEGGGAIVLEELEHAQARGAHIYAEIAGYAANTCAVNLTDPTVDGAMEAAAMQMALDEAGLAAEDVGYVAAHGTSTPKNDLMETKAIRKVFGSSARKVAVSSNKAQLGHTISGAAVTNVILAAMALRRGVIPPTMHLKNPDPDLDLDYVRETPRRASISAAIANSFAFGGQNAVIVLKSGNFR